MSQLGSFRASLPLDFRLGIRMLFKYPGLTVVAGAAMAFALWVGAVTFELTGLFLRPSLPLPDGERIVRLQAWDVVDSAHEARLLHDFTIWQNSLSAVTDLGAYRDAVRNLSVDGETQPVKLAETTAAAFAIAPTPPLLGRVLSAADEQSGAPPVVVLGHAVWRTRFHADASVLGRTVQLDGQHVTVVGVMPEGFAFPVAHAAWAPLTRATQEQAPRSGPAIQVFGRLAPGATLEQARSELSAVGQRMAAQYPQTHAHLTPQLSHYAHLFFDPAQQDGIVLRSVTGFALLLLLLVSGNVALLLFARAASRENELLVRSALGASRARISAQLVAEALVLGGVAAAVALCAAHLFLQGPAGHYLAINLGELPFWLVPRLSPATVGYLLALTGLAALVAGLLPALKITRAFGIGKRLRASSAGSGGLRLGGVWSVVIVLQVAAAVAFPAAVLVQQREAMRIAAYEPGFPAEEYLGVHLQREGNAAPDDATAQSSERAAFAASLEALRQRVLAEPGVTGVSFVDRLPRQFHREFRMELPADGTPPLSADAQAALNEVATARVDADYFALLGATPRAGRGFTPSDLLPGSNRVVVDQGFVQRVLQGRNPVGQRIRFASGTDANGLPVEHPWMEIIGVVESLGMDYVTHHHLAAGLYLPVQPGSEGPLWMMVHAPGHSQALAPRLRALAADTDPLLLVNEVQRVNAVADDLLWFLALWVRVTLLLCAIALLLSLAGIYSVLSFTVARRTREIGVRVALGASGARIAAQLFRRPLAQVALGVTIGCALIALAGIAIAGSGPTATQVALLLGYALLMLLVCLAACAVPTRRALRIQASEALRAD